MEMSLRWATRSQNEFARLENPNAVFGIVQGGTDIALRREHLAELAALPFDGLALGGLAVGEAPVEMYETLEAVAPNMPEDRPRYLMGVGRPQDLIEAIHRGIDMFDCVMPTRNARNGQVFTRYGKLNLKNARFGGSDAPMDPTCSCTACSRMSAGYMHHLFRAGEMLGPILATEHNLSYYLRLMKEAREAIQADRWDAFRARCYHDWDGESS
jgi:queuine tRNA-ribosyltransferase